MDPSMMIVVNSENSGPNGDENLWVKFFDKPVQNNFKSEKEGRPIFDTVTFVSIITPGQTGQKIERKVSDADKDRFPKQWMNYQRGQSEKIEGTPIDQWPVLNTAQVEEMKALKFYTVEQVSAASDAQVNSLGPNGFPLRDKAKAFLAQARDTAAAQKFAVENEALKSELADAKDEMARLAARLEALENRDEVNPVEAPKRRGRPPKVQ